MIKQPVATSRLTRHYRLSFRVEARHRGLTQLFKYGHIDQGNPTGTDTNLEVMSEFGSGSVTSTCCFPVLAFMWSSTLYMSVISLNRPLDGVTQTPQLTLCVSGSSRVQAQETECLSSFRQKNEVKSSFEIRMKNATLVRKPTGNVLLYSLSFHHYLSSSVPSNIHSSPKPLCSPLPRSVIYFCPLPLTSSLSFSCRTKVHTLLLLLLTPWLSASISISRPPPSSPCIPPCHLPPSTSCFELKVLLLPSFSACFSPRLHLSPLRCRLFQT